MKMQVTSDQWQVAGASSRGIRLVTHHASRITRSAFTLIEVLVVVALLSLIVVALMGVFTATQKAFRSSMTQKDVLEGGRAAMDLISSDLKQLSPSLDYYTNYNGAYGAVNFNVSVLNATPLYQPLMASPGNQQRTNLLENFFILSRENQTWTGTGYVVDANSTNGINPLYRFTMSTNATVSPLVLYNAFAGAVTANNFSGMSRLLDGVVTLRLHALDNNGYLITGPYNYVGGLATTNNNVLFLPNGFGSGLGEVGFQMFSNALPSAVEIEMATLEDRILQHASVWPNNSPSQTAYLGRQAGNLHVFRQRVSVPNANAYQ